MNETEDWENSLHALELKLGYDDPDIELLDDRQSYRPHPAYQ